MTRVFHALHSNLVLFKWFIVTLSIPPLKYLYIPIWFYSNNSKSLKPSTSVKSFTFQSGSIQMNLMQIISNTAGMLYIPIWFYSNSVAFSTPSLASNFTFQSGSIQMMMLQKKKLTSWHFTFQSGSIQICL